MVEQITSMEKDFSKWFTDIVKKADLIDYSSVKGCMIFRPYGYAIWENIQKILDAEFKKTNHQNVYMPLFIPESLLEKEKKHIEGFSPEVAWVTHGGDEKLGERLCVRPTSETLFCEHYKNIIHSYRDLPLLYNQWCSVVRWEKSSRPFLRNIEFLWQEGHTMHETEKEAMDETLQMLNIYSDFVENVLCIPVIKGQKTDKEKFAGAEKTFTVESMMHDGKALQSATSHYFGNGFSKSFDIEFTDKNNEKQNPYQTSWGCSTRLIGGVIMAHGDDNGLVLPFEIAPIQIVIIPIALHKDGVKDKVLEICERLNICFRVKVDLSDNSPGWKFSEYEMKGVPIRIEVGPKDIENNQVVLVRRDNREKHFVSLDNLEEEIKNHLKIFSENIFNRAKINREKRTFICSTVDEINEKIKEKDGFVKADWCGSLECEENIKDKTGLSSRCILLDEKLVSGKCVYCSKEAKYNVVWGKSY